MPAASTTLARSPKRSSKGPQIFGRGLRDRLLMALAIHPRPLYVAELCTLLRSDSRKVRNTLLPLLSCGVVVKDDRAFGARYLALNIGWPAYPQLVKLLRALDRRFPQHRLRKPRRKAERLGLRELLLEPDHSDVSAKQIDRLFNTAVRTRVLLGIAAIGNTDTTDLAGTLGLDSRSVWNAINHWEREGITWSRICGRRRAIALDPHYPEGRELRLLLSRLVAITHEYATLARFSSRVASSPRFVGLR